MDLYQTARDQISDVVSGNIKRDLSLPLGVSILSGQRHGVRYEAPATTIVHRVKEYTQPTTRKLIKELASLPVDALRRFIDAVEHPKELAALFLEFEEGRSATVAKAAETAGVLERLGESHGQAAALVQDAEQYAAQYVSSLPEKLRQELLSELVGDIGADALDEYVNFVQTVLQMAVLCAEVIAARAFDAWYVSSTAYGARNRTPKEYSIGVSYLTGSQSTTGTIPGSSEGANAPEKVSAKTGSTSSDLVTGVVGVGFSSATQTTSSTGIESLPGLTSRTESIDVPSIDIAIAIYWKKKVLGS